MKKLSLVLLVMVSFLGANAQKNQGWQALNEMKVIMKKTFPPMLKANNLEPAKDNAAMLYEAAINLQNAEKPRAFKKNSMKEKFENITFLSKKLKESVEDKHSDEDIKNTLVDLHAAFAEIAHHKKAGGPKH